MLIENNSGGPFRHNGCTFHSMTASLRVGGQTVELNPEGGTWHECMRSDMEQMVRCDHVATLPGWDKSQGAQLEVYIADRLGIRDSPAHTITEYQVQPCSNL
ncbi:DUF4406 domain-containing protein [Pseudomonas sp. ICMP 561]|uniref:DUF4406 domain-containing protein n=1 Tax=Pseudomonas sp. ICMP 561 TaxID=1718918 RepID=UPI000C0860DB|nr:DUF4406 domain-containing protein [Pseudomonas sp. ICMP 561]PHN28915.1 hypothetical protein AO242_25870 [Pseudomonas sp. ICMP 561]